MSDWTLVFSGLVGAVFSFTAHVAVVGQRQRKRERAECALALFEKFQTSDSMLKARMVAQKYLVPGKSRTSNVFASLDFEEITEMLERSEAKEDQEARI